MKIAMRCALLGIFFLLFSRTALAEQYACQAAGRDFRTIYITQLITISSGQSGQLQTKWQDYVTQQYGRVQTTCSPGDPATYNQAIQSARRSGQRVLVVNWTPGALNPSPNSARAPNNAGNRSSSASQKKYRDGTQCVKLSATNGTGFNFWENHCAFPVDVSWFDGNSRNQGDYGTSLNIRPGGKDTVAVRGQYTMAACEYPGIVRNMDGGRWQRGNQRHSCR